MAYVTGDTLVRVELPPASGLSQDKCVLDFAFARIDESAPSETDDTNIANALAAFFNTNGPDGVSVAKYISPFIARTPAVPVAKFYNIVVGSLGSPRRSISLPALVAPTSSTGLPCEVAACLSFHADETGILEHVGGTRPAARRRGRVYIGPLIPGAVAEATAPYMLATQFTDQLRTAAHALAVAVAAEDWVWCVWSRSDVTLRPVVGGWTDNAPDTQRRRGPDPTSRTTWTVV